MTIAENFNQTLINYCNARIWILVISKIFLLINKIYSRLVNGGKIECDGNGLSRVQLYTNLVVSTSVFPSIFLPPRVPLRATAHNPTLIWLIAAATRGSVKGNTSFSFSGSLSNPSRFRSFLAVFSEIVFSTLTTEIIRIEALYT